MGRPDRTDAAVAGGSVAVAGLAVAVLGQGVAEWTFFAALLVAAGLLARALLDAWSAQRRARRHAAAVRAIAPEAVAAAAVRRERQALFDDISESLAGYLDRVGDLASTPAADGEALARRIRRDSQAAANELRRQLGLLRDPEPPPATAASPSARAAVRAALAPADLVLGALAGALALAEALAHRANEDLDRSLLAVLLTTVAASALTWRRVAPARACLGAGALFVVAALLGEGLIAGLWVLVTVGGLAWSALAVRGRGVADAGAALALVLLAGGATSVTDPDDAGVTWTATGAVVVAAAATRGARELGARARRQAEVRTEELQGAADAAVAAERQAVARELHDVVSHAVGLIAMQAAAAEVTWASDRATAEAALATIRATARSTLGELRRLHPEDLRPPRTLAEVRALIGRIEAAGTPVDASGLDDVPVALLELTYRVLQESLTNTLRHARGARATVRATCSAGALRLRIADDGPGSATDATRGYGLVGLRERVALAGGHLHVSSPPTGGFVVNAVLPLCFAPEVGA